MEHPEPSELYKKKTTKSTKTSYERVQLTKRILNISILSWKHTRDIFIKEWDGLSRNVTLFWEFGGCKIAIIRLFSTSKMRQTVLWSLHTQPKHELYITNELSLLTNLLTDFLCRFLLKRRKTQAKQTYVLSLLPLNSIHHLMEDKPWQFCQNSNQQIACCSACLRPSTAVDDKHSDGHSLNYRRKGGLITIQSPF